MSLSLLITRALKGPGNDVGKSERIPPLCDELRSNGLLVSNEATEEGSHEDGPGDDAQTIGELKELEDGGQGPSLVKLHQPGTAHRIPVATAKADRKEGSVEGYQCRQARCEGKGESEEEEQERGEQLPVYGRQEAPRAWSLVQKANFEESEK